MLISHHQYALTGAAVLLLACADAARAAHPLLTEDTGTQGRGNWQLEFTWDQERTAIAGGHEKVDGLGLVLSYGPTDTVDLIIGLPYARVRADGDPTVRGMGDVELAAKWRFWERDGLSLALRPGATFATGNEDKGLGSGEVSPGLLGILSYEFDPWALHLHLGYTHNRNVHDERRDITEQSIAVVRQIGERLQFVADVSRETNPDRDSDTAIATAVAGLVWSVSEDFDLDVGYRTGLSDTAPDSIVHLGAALRF